MSNYVQPNTAAPAADGITVAGLSPFNPVANYSSLADYVQPNTANPAPNSQVGILTVSPLNPVATYSSKANYEQPTSKIEFPSGVV